MGASQWSYFVRYQPDVEQALQELRRAVFEGGDYDKVYPYWHTMRSEDFLPPDPSLSEEDIAEYRAKYEDLQALTEPSTIEALLEYNAEQGTHSILDIGTTGEQPEFGVAAPLAPDQLVTFFGSDRPTRELIEEREQDLQEFLQLELERSGWQGTYVIVYSDNEPSEIYFTGYSGD